MSESLSVGQTRVIVRALRIVSGLVLLAFVTCHLLNASLGVVSVQAMDAARPYLTGIWTRQALSVLLMLALTVHYALGLWAIYQRPTLKTNMQDIVQMLTAVCIVPVAATHVVGMSMLADGGVQHSYAQAIRNMWISAPGVGLLQVVVITVVWVHGCAGLLTWLRAKPGARNVILWVYPLAVAIPIAALLGFSEAGRRVLAEDAATSTPSAYGSSSYGAGSGAYADRSNDKPASASSYGSTYRAAPAAPSGYGAPSAASGYGSGSGNNGYETAPSDYGEAETAAPIDFKQISAVTTRVFWWSIALAALTFLARAVRLRLHPVQPLYAVRDSEPMPQSRSGLSVLDVFREGNQPHASLCEGRGRCGTCAVHVISSDFPLPEPTPLEQRTLADKGLPSTARLACQLFPDGGRIEVQSIYPADYTYHDDEPDEDSPADASPEALT